MGATVYGYLHWTPDTFWGLSLQELTAAVKGIVAFEKAKQPNTTETITTSLKNNEIDELRNLINLDKSKK